jgi:hypothetical protein
MTNFFLNSRKIGEIYMKVKRNTLVYLSNLRNSKGLKIINKSITILNVELGTLLAGL